MSSHQKAASSRILILDFGAQYSQLIARRVREAHVYCELHPAHLELAAIRAFAEERIAEDGSCRLSKFHYPAEKWGPQPELAMTIAAMRAAEESGLANVHLCFWFDN